MFGSLHTITLAEGGKLDECHHNDTHLSHIPDSLD